MNPERQLREDIVRFGRLLYERGFSAAADGNLSCRLDDERILITPAGLCKGMLEPEDLVVADLRGRKIEGLHDVSSEARMHVLIYGARPDAGAVVHAHPPTATGFAVAGIGMTEPALAETVYALGEIPLAPYGMPGTPELSDALEPYVAEHDAMLMANHGVVCCGATLLRAYLNMELVEHTARILLVAHQLGGARPLSDADADKLRQLRERSLVPAGDHRR